MQTLRRARRSQSFAPSPVEVERSLKRLFVLSGATSAAVVAVVVAVLGFVQANRTYLALGLVGAVIAAAGALVGLSDEPNFSIITVLVGASFGGAGLVGWRGDVPLALAAALGAAAVSCTLVLLDRRFTIVGALATPIVAGLVVLRFEAPWAVRIGGFMVAAAIFAAMCLVHLAVTRRYRRLPALLHSLIASTAEAVIVVDSNQSIQMFGGSSEALLGYRSADILGKPFGMLLPLRLRKAQSRQIGQLLEGCDSKGSSELGSQAVIRHRSGAEISVGASFSRFRLDDGRCFVAVLLRDLRPEEAARERLSTLAESRLRLLASVSHELRTPLTAVVGFSELLLSDDAELTRRERREALETIRREAHDVAGVLDDLLVASRLELDQVPLSVGEVDLVDQARHVAASIAAQGVVEVPSSSQVDLVVVGDAARVRQVIRNLVGNALKHGTPPVRIEVERDGEHVVLKVIDGGPGPCPEVADAMFDAFVSGNVPAGRPGSFGLGLSISRSLARAMGGEVEFRRVEDETHFLLRLPLATS